MSFLVGVISDSHGSVGTLGNILMAMEAQGKLDAIIHLGDGYHDLSKYNEHLPPVYQVPGNCDMVHGALTQVISLHNIQLMLTHGHEFRVKLSTAMLLSAAKERGVKAALFGHTHQPYCKEKHGILLLNPGAAMMGHYAILRIEDNGALSVDAHKAGT